MPSEYDIEMTTDDTLELDTIIENSSRASKPINKIDTNANYDKNDLEGIQTHTTIFDPPESGEYDIYVNGQVLSVNVKSDSIIPDGRTHQWPVDKGVNDTIFDDETNNVDVTATDPNWVSDSSATGNYFLSLSGTTSSPFQFIDIPDDSSIRTFNDNFTFVLIFRKETISDVEFLINAYDSGGGNAQFWARTVENDDHIRFFCEDTDDSTVSVFFDDAATAIADGDRHLVALRRDGDTFSINVDGVDESSTTNSNIGDISTSTTEGLRIGGALDNDNTSDHDQDVFEMYNGTALTDSQLKKVAKFYNVI